MEVTLNDGRIATYEVIGIGGEPLLTFVGEPMPALEQPQPYRAAVLNWCATHPAKP